MDPYSTLKNGASVAQTDSLEFRQHFTTALMQRVTQPDNTNTTLLVARVAWRVTDDAWTTPSSTRVDPHTCTLPPLLVCQECRDGLTRKVSGLERFVARLEQQVTRERQQWRRQQERNDALSQEVRDLRDAVRRREKAVVAWTVRDFARRRARGAEVFSQGFVVAGYEFMLGVGFPGEGATATISLRVYHSGGATAMPIDLSGTSIVLKSQTPCHSIAKAVGSRRIHQCYASCGWGAFTTLSVVMDPRFDLCERDRLQVEATVCVGRPAVLILRDSGEEVVVDEDVEGCQHLDVDAEDVDAEEEEEEEEEDEEEEEKLEDEEDQEDGDGNGDEADGAGEDSADGEEENDYEEEEDEQEEEEEEEEDLYDDAEDTE